MLGPREIWIRRFWVVAHLPLPAKLKGFSLPPDCRATVRSRVPGLRRSRGYAGCAKPVLWLKGHSGDIRRTPSPGVDSEFGKNRTFTKNKDNNYKLLSEPLLVTTGLKIHCR